MIRFAGFGGQGIVKAGEICGAAAVADGKQSLQTQSYGSSARGGLCTADVVVSEDELIYEVEPERFDVLVLLSQDSCDAYLDQLRSGGTLIVEDDLVRLPEGHSSAHRIPATRIAAQDLGRRIVTNMVMLGFCGAVTGLIGREALERTVRENVPRGTEELNLRAFDEGWRRGPGA
jgi:2-oxoglutarate ferredoxin oxidoreductase subunit gamma